ncbi:hypothetical protein WH52_03265 [Tenacibaculum holothuriorum]|uniref:Uncharacterized protein n=1 Tax=Tenacibaculum holothuriorum TaxID=1635173 RepID=A0A1Y2PG67_9FLAO|nr:hypothetical protein WH52_03265 [Tenacibaculum holothuriorum]
MSFSQKLIQSIIFLLTIPFFRVAFSFMLKKMENSFKRRNPKRMAFFYGYEKAVKFIIKYVWPIMIIICIISMWFNN